MDCFVAALFAMTLVGWSVKSWMPACAGMTVVGYWCAGQRVLAPLGRELGDCEERKGVDGRI